MLELERFTRVLKLSSLFSFFLFMLAFILTIFFTNLGIMLQATFLNTFIEIVNLFLLLLLKGIKYISVLFFAGSIIGLIVVFIQDLLIKPTKDY